MAPVSKKRPRRFTAIAGWREIGGKRIYCRSRMEANYARYLEWWKTNAGVIVEWEHEPETFYFEGLKRGKNNYKPDFKVTLLDGRVYYVEVKGYMDARSKTVLKRMAKYHPDVTVQLVDKKAYAGISKKAAMFEGWE